MHHYFEAITNTSGDSLVGYFARVIDPATQNTVTMSADDNGTPIVTKSGVENMGSTDDYGNLDFYVTPGTYHLDIYAPNATSFIFRVPNVAMNSSKGDPGPQGNEGPQGEGLAEVMAPTGASLVGAKTSFTGAVEITQQDKNRASVSVLEFIPPSLHSAIFGRATNNSKANGETLAGYIQAAIDAAAAQRRTLTIPAGLYNIAPYQTFGAEAGACKQCFAIRSNMRIEAEDGATFRIVNGISTDALPVFMCMFGTNEQLIDFSWYGLAMDMNGTNNPISPNRNNASLSYNGYSIYNQAQIFVSGTPSGNAANGTNVLIERCKFVDCPGVSCIVGAQTNAAGAALGRYWTIKDNLFRNNGYDSHDHSTIFAWYENGICEGNRFVNDTQIGDLGSGGVAFYEVHGANQTIRNNYVENYFQGMWIDTNNTRRTENVIIDGNTFNKMKAYGIQTYGLAAVNTHPRKVQISNNIIKLDNLTHPAIGLKGGIAILSPYTMADFDIYGNQIYSGGTAVGSAGVIVSNANVAGEKHTNINIHNNTFNGTTIGASVATNSITGLGLISITDNISINLTPAGAFGFPQGISFGGGSQKIDYLIVKRNICIDDRSTPLCAFGIRLEGAAKTLDMEGNSASGMSASPYQEASFTADKRKGVFENIYAADPPSMAAGAKSPIVTVPFPGAEGGDLIAISYGESLQGARVSAFLASTGNISYYFINEAGSDPLDLPPSFVRIKITKPIN